MNEDLIRFSHDKAVRILFEAGIPAEVPIADKALKSNLAFGMPSDLPIRWEG
jgi:hypothetical protein